MPRTLRIGRMTFETKSLLVGLCVAYAGLNIPQTKSIFNKIYTTIGGFVAGFFKK